MKHAESVERRGLERGASVVREAARRALQLVGVSAAGVVLGCGDADDDGYRTTDSAVGIVDREPGFVPLACTEGEYQYPVYVDDLRPPVPVDYLALRSGPIVLESRGAACSGAADPSACRTALDALLDSPEFSLGGTERELELRHLVGTRGDEVLRMGTLAELLGFLGNIDSVGEAQLVVATQGYELRCGESGVVPKPDGFDVLAFTYQGCDGRTRHLVRVAPSGQTRVTDVFVEREPARGCIPGRRPEGLSPRVLVRSCLGRYFAGCAELEAASVPAFSRLARELSAHGAPRGLVRRALSSARDEMRHARHVGALARRFGGAPHFPRIAVGAVRSLERVALENAVEGCVHETYAALVAQHQAARSSERVVAATHHAIAADELRHAELAWDVAHWLEPRLPPSARHHVTQARRQAAAALARDLARSRPSPIDAVAGLPSPSAGLALAEHLAASLWREGIG